MEIKRDLYLEQLKIRKDNGMIKIITGIGRCGKSFLLFVLFKKYLLESGVDNSKWNKKPWRNEEGFVIMGMKYFLLNEDSLEF